jgi:hypothetical protein
VLVTQVVTNCEVLTYNWCDQGTCYVTQAAGRACCGVAVVDEPKLEQPRTLGDACPTWSRPVSAPRLIAAPDGPRGSGASSGGALRFERMRAKRPKMGRLWIAFGLLATGLLIAPPAVSHGAEVPGVLSVVATDSTGLPSVLRLNEGLALRQRGEWRFLCPRLWGDDQVVPAVSTSGGAIIVASSGGLLLLDPTTGVFAQHPDPEAASGRTLSLRATGERALQLRAVDGLSQVLLVDDTSAVVLFEDNTAWETLDANQNVIALARVLDPGVETLHLALDGTELARGRAASPPDAVAAYPRLADERIYLVALTGGGLSSELGQIEGGEWVSAQRVVGSIAGPIDAATGGVWLSLGGELGKLDEGLVAPTGDTQLVTCVGSQASLTYACAEAGLWQLDNSGLGEELFDLSELKEPAWDEVPDAFVAECEVQWQRYQLDLMAIGIKPRPPREAGGDAGQVSAVQPPTSSCSWYGKRGAESALSGLIVLGVMLLRLTAASRRAL